MNLIRRTMKIPPQITENFDWNSIKNRIHAGAGAGGRLSPKFLLFLVIFATSLYVLFTITFIFSSQPCHDHRLPTAVIRRRREFETELTRRDKTELKHIMFGIAASASLWEKRKEYLKLWWKPENKMRGFVWLDKPVEIFPGEKLPKFFISGNTSGFRYTNRKGHRSAIRISRIVSETVRRGVNGGVRWFVMGDDDTVFVTENLVRVLSKYDHGGFYYIGSSSESHVQNLAFSYLMAYGGGGFAISYPLAVAIEQMQDRCLRRYPSLYGSDDRLQACMAELGVPLTKELGFHQCDLYGDIFGILAAHPVTPLVTLHHLDLIEPIFPNMTRVQSLKHLMIPMKLDSAGLIQQSICYEREKKWTISISWGFAVQVFRGYVSPKELEMPPRTFLNWYKKTDYRDYSFNTRPVARNPCQKPFIFYLSKAKLDSRLNVTETKYVHRRISHLECKWKMAADPDLLERIVVYKKLDPSLWDRSPRRNCCRVKGSKTKSLVLEVGVCKETEISEL